MLRRGAWEACNTKEHRESRLKWSVPEPTGH
jgi:hypothetical protein